MPDVDFRIAGYGQLECTVEGEDYYLQWYPCWFRDMTAPPELMIAYMDYLGVDMAVLQHDHVYGSLNELVISKNTVVYPPRVIRLGGSPSETTKPYEISGPTCDTLDLLPVKLDLPTDLTVGDWVELGLAGAYTNSMSTRFNGLYSEQWVSIEGDIPPGFSDG